MWDQYVFATTHALDENQHKTLLDLTSEIAPYLLPPVEEAGLVRAN